MSLRTSRVMTSIYLEREGQILLLYRVGSRAIADSWVGVGGHLEPEEIGDPTRGVLRELEEEVGIGADSISGLALRYVALRDTGSELRCTYYFTATLASAAQVPTRCDEGELRWFDLTLDPSTLPMPPTGSVALEHWLAVGRHDDDVRSIVMTGDGPRVLSLS